MEVAIALVICGLVPALVALLRPTQVIVQMTPPQVTRIITESPPGETVEELLSRHEAVVCRLGLDRGAWRPGEITITRNDPRRFPR